MLNTIGKQFKQPSGFFGRIISLFMKKGNLNAYKKLIPILEIHDKDKLLEIGYGHGLGIYNILSGFNCSIDGIDFSKLMFNEASKRNKKYITSGKLKLQFGDFLQFELKPGEYDHIYCLNVVYFWDDLSKAFSKIRSGLKNHGQFSFYMAHRDDLNKFKFTKDGIFNKYTIEEVIDKLNLSGFKNIKYQYDKGYFVKCSC
jgi:SAM-dependent methyltransferase